MMGPVRHAAVELLQATFHGTPAAVTRGDQPAIGDVWPKWSAIRETLTFQAGFNTNIVILGTMMLGLAAGIVGVFALLRKRALMADALSHATLPGIGLIFILGSLGGLNARSLPVLLIGAAISGVLGVICIQLLVRHTRLREDASIGIVLSVFFGAGIVLLSVIQTMETGTAAGLNKFIYGQTAAMSIGDATLMTIIAMMAIIATCLLTKEFALVCFNDDFARVNGWRVSAIDLMMMGMVVVVTVTGLQAVGLILVVAMLIIPAVSARFWTQRIWLLLVVSGVIGALSGYFGSAVSALLPRKPAGSVIVLTSGVFFVLSMTCAPGRGLLATSGKRLRLRLRFAQDHILEASFDRTLVKGRSTSLDSAEIRAFSHQRRWPFWMWPIVMTLLRGRGMLRRIEKGSFELTERGRIAGARISRNHALWEQYLISYADIAPSHVDWSVDQVEHVLSDRLVNELEAALAARGIDLPSVEVSRS